MLLNHWEKLLLERIADFFADSRMLKSRVLLAARRLRLFSLQSRILYQAYLTRILLRLFFDFLFHVWFHLFVESAGG